MVCEHEVHNECVRNDWWYIGLCSEVRLWPSSFCAWGYPRMDWLSKKKDLHDWVLILPTCLLSQYPESLAVINLPLFSLRWLLKCCQCRRGIFKKTKMRDYRCILFDNIRVDLFVPLKLQQALTKGLQVNLLSNMSNDSETHKEAYLPSMSLQVGQ